MHENLILNQLSNYPSLLFVGENNLNNATGKNIFVEKILQKYGKAGTKYNLTYDNLLKLSLEKDCSSALSWMLNLSSNISITSSYDKISNVQWSAVYTSAIDNVLERALISSSRRVFPVCDDRTKSIDPRNKKNLHITYLYGSVEKLESSKRPPLTLFEKVARQKTANVLIQRIPEIITSKGMIFIEAYDCDNDWVTMEDLYGLISSFGDKQAAFFSVNNSLQENPFFQDLIDRNKIISFKESLAEKLFEIEVTSGKPISSLENDDKFGRWIDINKNKVRIPDEISLSLNKCAIIIDDSIFDLENEVISDDQRYSEFRKFLGQNDLNKMWKGFSQNFAFKRDFYHDLFGKVKSKLHSRNFEIPIILHGQSSSGKTVMLGELIYSLAIETVDPIIYIDKKLQKADFYDVEIFCNWAEERGAKSTIIVWDGMCEIENYYDLSRYLSARGRNALLIGSSYNLRGNKLKTLQHVEANVDLSRAEQKSFKEFLRNIDVLLSNVVSSYFESNNLAMFYRYLPDSRQGIKFGLRKEFDHFSKLIRDLNKQENSRKEKQRTTMFDLLSEAGLLQPEQVIDLSSEENLTNEYLPLSDKLINSIMVCGQFGLNIPYDVLFRSLGGDIISSNLFRILNKIDIVTWSEDSTGDIKLGARNAVEAHIMVQYIGGKLHEVEYFKALLSSIRVDFDILRNYESNSDLQFAVDLLNFIGPKNSDSSYNGYLYDITNTLRINREKRDSYHPRLILKEANFLREIVINKMPAQESYTDLLNRAEEIVREALLLLQGYTYLPIYNFLNVELASILGSKTIELSRVDHVESLACFRSVKDTIGTAFAALPDHYNALDVRAWTTDHMLRNNLLNPDEKLEVIAEMLSLFDLAESEGIKKVHEEDFYGRRMVFLDAIGTYKTAEEDFQRLANLGFTSGIYLRTRIILNKYPDDEKLNPTELAKKYGEASDYLSKNFDKVKEDSKCLFLLLKTWWITRNKTTFFFKEKQTIPFKKEDWEYCLMICNLLVNNDDTHNIALVSYLKAISEFHLGLYSDSFKNFRTVDILTDFSGYGKRRVVKSYVASTSDGKPKLFDGEVTRNVSRIKGDKRGELFVRELMQNIPFLLSDFSRSEFNEGEVLRSFSIGFNFRGPIAFQHKF